MAFPVLQTSYKFMESYSKETSLSDSTNSTSQTYDHHCENNSNSNNNVTQHEKRSKTDIDDSFSKSSQDERFLSSFRIQDSEILTSSKDLDLRNNNKCVKPDLEVTKKVLLIGDAGVGKSTYVRQYISRIFDARSLWTAGVDFALKLVKWSDNINIKLQLWDIAGQERFASMTRVYYKDAHACIVMFDLTQRQSFLNARKWKQDLDSKCTLPDGSPVPCILLGNKCDLGHREIEQHEIEQFCKEQEFIGWTEISVKDDLMVDESMKFLLDDMMSRYASLEDSTTVSKDNKVVRLDKASDNSTTKKKCSC